MQIVFETQQDIALTPLELRSKTVRCGVGAFISDNIHTVAYLSTKGVWGAFSLGSATHRCEPGCGLKTELLGLARVLQRTTEKPEHLTVTLALPKAAAFLEGVKNQGAVPLWDYTTAIGNYAEQFERLKGFSWAIGSSTSPATEARGIARRIHSFVTNCQPLSALPRAILSDCQGIAELTLRRV